MTRFALALLPLIAACSSDPTPAWAVDPIWAEPTAGGMHGFQTWKLYAARWEKKHSDKTFVCAVVVELEGTETPCTECQIAWETTATVLESDCDAGVETDPTWTLLQRLSVGLAIEGVDAAHPGFTSQGFADYGWGWEVHGQAWPDALDHGQSAADGSWDGTQPFAFEPELAWPLLSQ